MPSLTCEEYQTCDTKTNSKATFFCLQCNSLQCILCEKQLHENIENKQHDRLSLDQINGQFCSVDRQHPAAFYCPTCALLFCYLCYEKRHQHADRREHRPQKSIEGQILTGKKNK
jgi:zinc finger FYVE domain-containing protein 1